MACRLMRLDIRAMSCMMDDYKFYRCRVKMAVSPGTVGAADVTAAV